MGQNPTEEEIYRMISEVDENNTGHIRNIPCLKIDFSQFKRVIAEQKKNQSLANEEDTRKRIIP